MLWDDTFVRYHEPNIGIAAVAVLEAAGFEVCLPRDRKCCGRPAFSQGNLDDAAKLGRHNLDMLAPRTRPDTPIIFLEPSCYSMFAEDYRELNLPGAEAIAAAVFCSRNLSKNCWPRTATRCASTSSPATIAIHAHCHAKSLTNPAFMAGSPQRLPNAR